MAFVFIACCGVTCTCTTQTNFREESHRPPTTGCSVCRSHKQPLFQQRHWPWNQTSNNFKFRFQQGCSVIEPPQTAGSSLFSQIRPRAMTHEAIGSPLHWATTKRQGLTRASAVRRWPEVIAAMAFESPYPLAAAALRANAMCCPFSPCTRSRSHSKSVENPVGDEKKFSPVVLTTGRAEEILCSGRVGSRAPIRGGGCRCWDPLLGLLAL
jgi:hypothetical protein